MARKGKNRGQGKTGMHNAMCKTKNGVPSVKSVSVMAGGGAAVGTEPCREDSQAVPPQEKDRCQWERDGVPAPLFLVKPT